MRSIIELKAAIMFATTLFILCFAFFPLAAGDGSYCNPVLNVNTCYNSTLKKGNVQVTTELQVEHVTELFKNVSESLLNEYEKRFEAFLGTIDNKARPRDCDDIQRFGFGTGVHVIYPGGGSAVRVRCDMLTTSGGWTVIQRRVSNNTDFYRTWDEYRFGFGVLENNFWLGNDNIHKISSQGYYELRIDMSNAENETRYAEYDDFLVSDIRDRFRLKVGKYHGDAGDSITARQNGRYFSTWDADNDVWPRNCAITHSGAWWYGYCHHSNLSGLYGNTAEGKGINWSTWQGYSVSLKTVEMKIRKWGPVVPETVVRIIH